MNLNEPSLALLEAPTRAGCAQCDLARSSWASGGYHLSCRACEIRAVADSAIDTRQAFYASLVADAGAACSQKRDNFARARARAYCSESPCAEGDR